MRTQLSCPRSTFGHDLGAMRAAIGDDTKLVFVASPNNPTGTFIDAAPLLAFLQSVPAHVTVLLDEAYTEYLVACAALRQHRVGATPAQPDRGAHFLQGLRRWPGCASDTACRSRRSRRA